MPPKACTGTLSRRASVPTSEKPKPCGCAAVARCTPCARFAIWSKMLRVGSLTRFLHVRGSTVSGVGDSGQGPYMQARAPLDLFALGALLSSRWRSLEQAGMAGRSGAECVGGPHGRLTIRSYQSTTPGWSSSMSCASAMPSFMSSKRSAMCRSMPSELIHMRKARSC